MYPSGFYGLPHSAQPAPLFSSPPPTPFMPPTMMPTYNPVPPPSMPPSMACASPFSFSYGFGDQQVAAWFNSVDSDKSGTIDAKELQYALQLGGFKDFSISCSAKLVRMFDTSAKGSLNVQEFFAVHKYLIRMQQSFQMVDTDKNGTLEFDELCRCFQGAGIYLSQQGLLDVFRRFDVKRTGRLTFDEYIELCICVGLAAQVFARNDIRNTNSVTFTLDTFISACSFML